MPPVALASDAAGRGPAVVLRHGHRFERSMGPEVAAFLHTARSGRL